MKLILRYILYVFFITLSVFIVCCSANKVTKVKIGYIISEIPELAINEDKIKEAIENVLGDNTRINEVKIEKWQDSYYLISRGKTNEDSRLIGIRLEFDEHNNLLLNAATLRNDCRGVKCSACDFIIKDGKIVGCSDCLDNTTPKKEGARCEHTKTITEELVNKLRIIIDEN